MTKNLAPGKFDVVGSFLRPEILKKARRDFEDGKIKAEGLRQVEDKAIRELVEKEKNAGLKFYTDGEFRRSWWHFDFWWGFEGLEREIDKNDSFDFNGKKLRRENIRVKSKVSSKNHPFLDHFKFIQKFEEDDFTPKLTIPAIAVFLAQSIDSTIGIEDVYDSTREFIDDLVKAYVEFVDEFYKIGGRVLQFDDVSWIGTVDENYRKKYENSGKTIDELRQEFLDYNNKIYERAPKDLQILTHICRGNFMSHWLYQGAYDDVADYVFAKEDIDGFFLEYDDERSGDFKALVKIPAGKKVVLGIVTSKRPELEDKEELIKRIKDAANYIPLENICISPQCGFSSTEEGNAVTEEDQWKKIALLKQVAEEVLI
ncbi:MAG: 5-methyltetrahydropteroyltriglutamate--homocysteine S-methyltransferase [Peptoniphilus harei]|uniref:Methionine synthase, vitamin-B12 independent n=1 Tax=Peptoniphilus harei ACS-146-V-Sch2b TaxID=908338 RepID=E4KWS7_9FIRM|nr:5-methyltetrahydropteroyltriglutamate--homocysteine S-methyltransferase [Peptoniphilus harei]EFR33695.1 methionine synthase, vitamin-B12 independent [Peptoniphilus harei ACS-146-V-Sch2b]MDK7377012.1 5-methyltetrahydropteroyltriglutamate--homocysteine S-methyltransferase [Peptoniphilus harei]MDK7678520.1 5-methyltetrahydropteroyltriglutamate--homocysteine S-methyltransferase [Peptoniphilus harei]MDK7754639.1 5-methyltetrahydropteroyltriglutamate--homocysteine S-methyltransferase [Peptoniphilu